MGFGLGNLNPFGDDFLGTGYGLGSLGGALNRGKAAEEAYGGVDQQGDMRRISLGADRFGRQAQHGYNALGREAGVQRDALRRRAAGQDSLSAEQLRQGLATNTATQMGLAAGRNPAGGAAAARTASNNVAMMGAGLAGQQATAGIQERAAAENQLTQAILGQRAQDAGVAMGGAQTALGGLGQIEQNRTNRYGAMMGTPTPGEQVMGGAMGAGALFAMSDERAKKNIKRGADKEALALVRSLKSNTFEYKDEANGKGEFVGIMTKDLRRSKAGRAAVVVGPDGLDRVHGARLATAIAATLPGLDKRLRKLEGK